jgi:hypothetical protein
VAFLLSFQLTALHKEYDADGAMDDEEVLMVGGPSPGYDQEQGRTVRPSDRWSNGGSSGCWSYWTHCWFPLAGGAADQSIYQRDKKKAEGKKKGLIGPSSEGGESVRSTVSLTVVLRLWIDPKLMLLSPLLPLVENHFRKMRTVVSFGR